MRGCQRKVIFLKNTGSDMFDEAYFVVSRDCEKEKICEDSMIAAANRIINDSIELDKEKKKKRIIRFILKNILPFAIGACLSAVVMIIF